METQLGKRICQFFHATMLVASVLEKNDMNTLTKGYEALSGDLHILSTYARDNGNNNNNNSSIANRK